MLLTIAVVLSNGVPLPFFSVYQPPNAYPGRLVVPSSFPASARL